MDSIIRNVDTLRSADRQAIEHLLGQSLDAHQQLVIQVKTPSTPPVLEAAFENGLPEWCQVYAGLTDSEVAKLEQAVLERSNLTRSAE